MTRSCCKEKSGGITQKNQGEPGEEKFRKETVNFVTAMDYKPSIKAEGGGTRKAEKKPEVGESLSLT